MNECAQEHLVDGNEIGAANDLFLVGCAQRELEDYANAVKTFEESRSLFKKNKEVSQVARCDQKIASCYVELGEGEKALEKARLALDVFETAHDHRKQTLALFEYAKAQVLIGELDEALGTFDQVLTTVTDEDTKDFEFIVEIEFEIANVFRMQGRYEEAEEIERRLSSVNAILDDEESTEQGS